MKKLLIFILIIIAAIMSSFFLCIKFIIDLIKDRIK